MMKREKHYFKRFMASSIVMSNRVQTLDWYCIYEQFKNTNYYFTHQPSVLFR